MCIYEVTGISHVTRNLYTHFANYITCYCHILLKKYSSNIARHTMLILYGYMDTEFVYKLNPKTPTNCNIYFTSYCHICAKNKSGQQTAHISNICKQYDMHIWGCMSIQVPYIGSNKGTRNTVHRRRRGRREHRPYFPTAYAVCHGPQQQHGGTNRSVITMIVIKTLFFFR